MAVQQYNIGDHTIILVPGTYKIVAIGPGGDGATGGTSSGKNSEQEKTVFGAYGGGGGAGAYIYIYTLEVSSLIALGLVINQNETKVFSSMTPLNIILNKEGLSGSPAGQIDTSVPVPGNSVAPLGVFFKGSRGGGAGGTQGTRLTDTLPQTTTGGLGDHGNGDDSIVGVLTGRGNHRAAGDGASGGGGNPVSVANGGDGGVGANDNGLVMDDAKMTTITHAELATYINGGSGGHGSAPASRPAVTGMPGGTGGGGGGAWTSGLNGAVSGAPSAGLNGAGGAGGLGGTGSVWIMELVNQKTR